MGNITASIGHNPFSTNNAITCTLYKVSDIHTVYRQITKERPETSSQTDWVFVGLDRTNYYGEFTEAGNPSPLDTWTMVPNTNGFSYKEAKLIQVGVTTGWIAGNSAVTLDGTDDKDDWRGQSIHIERIGTGTMKEAIDYTFDQVTGEFTLAVEGDVFGDGEFFFVEFEPKIDEGGGVDPDAGSSDPFTSKKIIVGADSILNTDAKKKIIIKGESNYFEVELPELSTVQEFKLFYIESGRGAHKCVYLKCKNADIIDWLEGDLPGIYMCPNESLQLYKEITDDGPVWRVHSAEGNFLTVGEDVHDDMNAAGVFNKVPVDGSYVAVNDYARFYYRYVINLPIGQLVSVADWPSNKTKFSLADNTDHFYMADRRGFFDRASDNTRVAGSYQDDALKSHDHVLHGKGEIPSAFGDKFLSKGNNHFSGGGSTSFGGKGTPDESLRTGDTGNTETRPKNVAINKYKRC